MNCLENTLGIWMMKIDLHLPTWRVLEIFVSSYISRFDEIKSIQPKPGSMKILL